SCRWFFFSSRRRHTRFSRDWSSDVCSSDLAQLSETRAALESRLAAAQQSAGDVRQAEDDARKIEELEFTLQIERERTVALEAERSEERRVGKEWRSRGARRRK